MPTAAAKLQKREQYCIMPSNKNVVWDFNRDLCRLDTVTLPSRHFRNPAAHLLNPLDGGNILSWITLVIIVICILRSGFSISFKQLRLQVWTGVA